MTVTVHNRPTSRLTSIKAHWKPLAAVLAILTVFAAYITIKGTDGDNRNLAPTSTEQSGAAGFVHLLKSRNYNVKIVRHDRTMRSAIRNATPDTTVIVSPDIGIYRNFAQDLDQTRASRIILLEPSQQILDKVGIQAQALTVQEALAASNSPNCSAEMLSPVNELDSKFRSKTYESDEADHVCFPAIPIIDNVNRGGLLTFTQQQKQTILLGNAYALTNRHLASKDSAALGLALVGNNKNVIWADPRAADLKGQQGTSGEGGRRGGIPPQLSWLNLLAWWSVFLAIVAAFWRGRRLGRIVVEYLPVMVRASETAKGLGRSYSVSASHERSLELLQSAAALRIAKKLGVPSYTPRSELISVVASALGRSSEDIESVLTRKAHTAQDLISGTANLDSLERQVRRLVEPETPGG